MLEAQKVHETISDKYTYRGLYQEIQDFIGWFEATRQAKALTLGVFLIVYGLIVLSFDKTRSRPGTEVVRNKIFGIEQRYFLVYYNGLLAYLFIMYCMDDSIPPERK